MRLENTGREMEKEMSKMGKTLVVYYSRGGNTRKVGNEIANILHAEIEEIVPLKEKKGIIDWIISGRQGMSGEVVDIKPANKNPQDYDLVVVGTPIWAGYLSSPTRKYLREKRGKFRKVAFFSTASDDNGERAFKQMEEECGVSPVAVHGFRLGHTKRATKEEISEFANKLKEKED